MNEFSVHNSFLFAYEIIIFCLDHFIAGLEVESLFTNNPLHEDNDIYINALFSESDINKKLIEYDLRELLTSALLMLLLWGPYWNQ